MERSAHLNEYSYLSRYYHELFVADIGYDLWWHYLKDVSGKNYLELASGDGLFALYLKEKGLTFACSDIDVSMKEVALNNGIEEYQLLNMSDYHLDQKFDNIITICDSFNYLNKDELKGFFNCAYEHLAKGGKLIFDMHHPDVLESYKEEYIEEGILSDNNQYQWTILAEDECLNINFVLFDDIGHHLEQHQQFIHYQEDILKYDNLFNFTFIEDFVPEEKILIMGERL